MKVVLLLLLAAIAAGCTPTGGSQDAAECSTAADCVIAGCSGQVCTTPENGADMLTTCEYREEFGCLEKTSCGCIEGRCGWAQTPEYEECLQQAIQKEINSGNILQ